MRNHGLLGIILFGCLIATSAVAEVKSGTPDTAGTESSAADGPPPKFPKRSGGMMSNELFSSALAQSERDLRDTLETLQENQRRYLSGESSDMDPLEMIRLGQQAIELMQQIDTLKANRAASSGVTMSPGALQSDASTCEMFSKYAEQCKRGQEAAESLGASPSDQTGVFETCYSVFMGVYRAKCQ